MLPLHDIEDVVFPSFAVLHYFVALRFPDNLLFAIFCEYYNANIKTPRFSIHT